MENEFFERLKQIRAFAFDVDGVWTDGGLLVLEDGNELRYMNVKDGYAATRAIQEKMKIVIISGKASEGLRYRFESLGIENIFLDERNKLGMLERFLLDHGISKEQVLCMGDDLPDYDMLNASGIAACPADAVSDIVNICSYQSDKKGGEGCVRDVIEKTMRAKEIW